MTPTLIPAILTLDPGEAKRKLATLARLSEWVQIDVTDGQFVPGLTIRASDLANHGTPAKIEVHLMVEKAERFFEEWRSVPGVRRFIFPIESLRTATETLAAGRAQGFEVELGLNPETSIDRIEPYVPAIDGVLFLSVIPGAQGHPFIPEVLEKVKAFRAAHPGVPVTIDGGVNETNIRSAATAGVDRIVVGSGLFRDPADPAHHLERLGEMLAE